VRDNIHFVEDNIIVYPAGASDTVLRTLHSTFDYSPPAMPGNYIVKYFIATKAQEFAPCSETALGVTATVSEQRLIHRT